MTALTKHQRDAGKALRLFRDFHGRTPRRGEMQHVKGVTDQAIKIGTFDGVIYTDLAGQTYIHRFNKNRRPLLFVSADGKQFYALRGAYRFTDRGFIG